MSPSGLRAFAELTEDQAFSLIRLGERWFYSEPELAFLQAEIYRREVDVPMKRIDAYCRRQLSLIRIGRMRKVGRRPSFLISSVIIF
jgi:hypothetical protein